MVLFGFTLFMFAVTYILPGDPIRALFGFTPPSPEEYQALVHQYGLDQPFIVQYGRYLGHLLRFDLGESYRFGQPVNAIVLGALPNSLRLLGFALFGEVVIGIGAAAWAVHRKGSFIDTAVGATSMLVVSIPVFVLAYVSRAVFALRLRWLPTSGTPSWTAYILPGIVIAVSMGAFMARLARAQLAEMSGADYITTARANGIPERRITGIHALRPALGPMVTLLAASTSALVTSLILVETVFAIPGLGGTVYSAIRARDQQVIIGVLFFVTIIVVFANLVADVLMAVFDPRIRLE